ncbi:hypothetical protein [Spirochaeta isovalerica]|uniref:Uncharacterized protein n=1 Tax=Spirochaeta isovalerica TaxID=150 RepID=A0A841R6H6_9SPIO|nr:hypothetical protein [Spirochaeta isovalerica]MBB6478777.1 hypothetical protein [Spirochaeta isovalerica]
MEGTIVNQVEISGFENEKDAEKFRKKLKSFKSLFTLPGFKAQDASFKLKDDFSLIYLFLTEDEYPEAEIKQLFEENDSLEIQHLVISPTGCGEMLHFFYSREGHETTEYSGPAILMLGDLIQGGFS